VRADAGARSKGVDPSSTEPDRFLPAVKQAYTDSYAKAKALLDFLADHPDRWVPFPEVNAALGFDNNRSLPGALGAFGRRAEHRCGGVKPFEARQSDGVWRLRMSPEAAAVINGLR
jgi:hypothetical protein